jgi:hypothetical protein
MDWAAVTKLGVGALLKTDWFSRAVTRTGLVKPGDREIEKDIRIAYLVAIQSVAGFYEDELNSSRQIAERVEREFDTKLRTFLAERLSMPTDKYIGSEAVTGEDIDLVLDELADFRAAKGRLKQVETARTSIIQRALSEIESKCGTSPSRFRSLFEGDPDNDKPGWYEFFYLLIIHQIGTNKRFSSLLNSAQLIDLKREIGGVSADMSKNFPELTNLIRSMDDTLRGLEKTLEGFDYPTKLKNRHSALKWPGRPVSKGDTVGSFRYYYAFDEFQGRESDFEAIEIALLSDTITVPFSWLGLYGDAGSGKSRFAMKLLEKNQTKWKGGFLEKFAINKDYAEQWAVGQPTLVIIDYAAGHQGLRGFIEAFANRENLEFPVRLLLIERSKHDKIFEDLLRTANDGVRLARAQLTCGTELYQLSSLKNNEIIALMEDRIGDSPVPYKGDQLVEVLKAFDPHCRPLFAAIVADALKQNSLPSIKDSEGGEEARFKLFRYLIQRERENIWKARQNYSESEKEREKILAQHEVLAALATMIRGLKEETYSNIVENNEHVDKSNNPFVPNSVDSNLYGAIWGEAVQGGYDYPSITPDLIGEYFVLDMIEDRDCYDRIPRAKRRNWLLQTAWQISRWDIAIFARMCFQDYPRHSISLDYLLPKSGKIDSAKSALMRGIAVEMAHSSRDRAPTVEELERAFQLACLVEIDLSNAAQQDVDVARNVAAVWCQVANLAARAINRNIGHESVGLDSTFEKKIASSRLAREAFGKASAQQFES